MLPLSNSLPHQGERERERKGEIKPFSFVSLSRSRSLSLSRSRSVPSSFSVAPENARTRINIHRSRAPTINPAFSEIAPPGAFFHCHVINARALPLGNLSRKPREVKVHAGERATDIMLLYSAQINPPSLCLSSSSFSVFLFLSLFLPLSSNTRAFIRFLILIQLNY